MKTLAAHQPNFCPWGSFFDKVSESDIFVLLGHVQYSNQGYQNRFRADSNWFTMSAVRNGKKELIKEKRYANPFRDWERITKSYNVLKRFDHLITPDLFYTNTEIIRECLKEFNINTPIVYDYPTELKSTERLVDLCKTYKADRYLSGVSGKHYMDLKLFEQEGIEVIFQNERSADTRPLVDMI